jgi:hypothetical protein
MELPEGWRRFICEACGDIHKVVIFKEGCKYRVEPGRLVVHPGALVRFVSLLPNPEIVFPRDVAEPQKGESGTWFRIKTERPGAYPYSVFVAAEGGGDMAEGGSSPRIIVADP